MKTLTKEEIEEKRKLRQPNLYERYIVHGYIHDIKVQQTEPRYKVIFWLDTSRVDLEGNKHEKSLSCLMHGEYARRKFQNIQEEDHVVVEGKIRPNDKEIKLKISVQVDNIEHLAPVKGQ